MRGAYGKPQGKVARVSIGQPLVSVRVKDSNKGHAIEALRRSKFKVFSYSMWFSLSFFFFLRSKLILFVSVLSLAFLSSSSR